MLVDVLDQLARALCPSDDRTRPERTHAAIGESDGPAISAGVRRAGRAVAALGGGGSKSLEGSIRETAAPLFFC